MKSKLHRIRRAPTTGAILRHLYSQSRSRAKLLGWRVVLKARLTLRTALKAFIGWPPPIPNAKRAGETFSVPTLVINLRERTDRWAKTSEVLEAFGIEATRFEACRRPIGLAGCAESHAQLLREQLTAKVPAVLVLEDDIVFHCEANHLSFLMQQFLEDTRLDVFCIAQISTEPKLRISEHLSLAQNIRTTAAYAVKARAIRLIADKFAESAEKIQAGGDPGSYALDIMWQELQRRKLLFAVPNTSVASQLPSYSDIQESFVDYANVYFPNPTA